MDNEKNKGVAMTSGTGKAVAGDSVTRRPWHKPTVMRIDLKRTMVGDGSAADGTGPTLP